MLGKPSFPRSRQIQRSQAKRVRPLLAAGFFRGPGGKGSQDEVGAAPFFGGDVFVGSQAFGHVPGLDRIAAIQCAEGHGQSDRFGRRLAMAKDHGRRDDPHDHGRVDRHDQQQAEGVGQQSSHRRSQAAGDSAADGAAVSAAAHRANWEVLGHDSRGKVNVLPVLPAQLATCRKPAQRKTRIRRGVCTRKSSRMSMHVWGRKAMDRGAEPAKIWQLGRRVG